MSYWGHRLLHTPLMYRYVHKLHHRYSHSSAVAAECSHPVDFALVGGIPFIAGPLLVGRTHAFTVAMWVVVRVVESLDAHSGFDFPWVPHRLWPWAAAAAEHDAHHSMNTGNYGSFLTLWDTLMGTAIPAAAVHSAVYARGADPGKAD